MSEPSGETTVHHYKRKTKGKVNNTCANSSLQKRMTRQLAGIMAHLEHHPHDRLSQARVATINNILRG